MKKINQLYTTYESYSESLNEGKSELDQVLKTIMGHGITPKDLKGAVTYVGNIKYKWNSKQIKLSKESIKDLVAIQEFIHENYPDLDYLLNWKMNNLPKEIEA